MPSTAALELLVSLKDNASSGLDAIGEKGGGMGDLVKGGAIAAGGSILALGGFLVAATKAASDEQVGMDRLGQTLTNNIPGWTGNENAVEGYVAKMENMAFADDDIRDSLNKLIPRTHDLTQAQNLQATAMDLARYKNIDLSTATDIVGKVYGGNTAILNRYGIAVDKGASATDALAQIQKVAGGQAQVYADSAAGGMERLQTAFGDALETVGHEILPAVTQALKGLADFISSPAFQAGFQAFADFLGNGLGKAMEFLQGAIQAIMPIIMPFIQAWANFFATLSGGGDVMAAIGQLFQNFAQAFGNAWNIISPVLGQMLQNIFNWIGANAPGILAQLGQWALAFGAWVWNTAIPALLQALGGLIAALWSWIQANGPGILQQLGQWALAFGNWVLTSALPWLLQQLGSLIGSLWNWIVANGPGIAQQLLSWAQIFGNWVLTTALPWLLQQLGSLIGSLWNWIVANGPGIAQQLLTWAQAFGAWVLNTALPALLQGLGSLIGTLWNWIVDNAPAIYQKLQSWKDAFFDWIFKSVLPQIPGWLGNIASALWTWLSQTAKDIGSKLVNEWLPAFWQWITGPGGVLATIGAKLAEVAQALWNWVTQTAKDVPGKVVEIGKGILKGIMDGLGGAASAIGNFLMGIAQTVWNNIVAFFTGGAQQSMPSTPSGPPSTTPPAHIGAPTKPPPGQAGGNFVGLGGFGGGFGGGTSIIINGLNIYAYPGMDGSTFASSFIDQLEEELSASVRTRRGV